MHLRWLSIIGLLMAGIGGAALWLVIVVIGAGPTQFLQIAFFVLLGITLAGLTIPVSAVLNSRFAQPGWQKRDPWRLLRQGAEVGIFGIVCMWLQKERLFNWTIGAVIIAVFILAEAFLLTRNTE